MLPFQTLPEPPKLKDTLSAFLSFKWTSMHRESEKGLLSPVTTRATKEQLYQLPDGGLRDTESRPKLVDTERSLL